MKRDERRAPARRVTSFRACPSCPSCLWPVFERRGLGRRGGSGAGHIRRSHAADDSFDAPSAGVAPQPLGDGRLGLFHGRVAVSISASGAAAALITSRVSNTGSAFARAEPRTRISSSPRSRRLTVSSAFASDTSTSFVSVASGTASTVSSAFVSVISASASRNRAAARGRDSPPGEYIASAVDAMLLCISSSCRDSFSLHSASFSRANSAFSLTSASSWNRTCSANGSDPSFSDRAAPVVAAARDSAS